MLRKLIFQLLLISLIANPVFADEKKVEAPGVFDVFTNLPRDWATWGKRSFRGQNLPIIGATLGVSVAMYAYDVPLWKGTSYHYQKNPGFYRSFSDTGNFIGDGAFQFGLSGAFGIYGFAASDNRALRTASQVIEVILATGLVIQTLKHLTGRESPSALDGTCSKGCWHGPVSMKKYFGHVSKYDAVPSGHIATSLATAQVIIENYPDAKWIPYVAYPVVGTVGLGIVANSSHWWSDIPFGLLIGYSFSQVVAHPDKKTEEKTSYVTPILEPNVAMITTAEGRPTMGLRWDF